jgi:hypothetical protein
VQRRCLIYFPAGLIYPLLPQQLLSSSLAAPAPGCSGSLVLKADGCSLLSMLNPGSAPDPFTVTPPKLNVVSLAIFVLRFASQILVLVVRYSVALPFSATAVPLNSRRLCR